MWIVWKWPSGFSVVQAGLERSWDSRWGYVRGPTREVVLGLKVSLQAAPGTYQESDPGSAGNNRWWPKSLRQGLSSELQQPEEFNSRCQHRKTTDKKSTQPAQNQRLSICPPAWLRTLPCPSPKAQKSSWEEVGRKGKQRWSWVELWIDKNCTKSKLFLTKKD